MTSKERVIATYNFKLPDRIPLDFCAIVPVYTALMDKLCINTTLELMEYFHIDFRWARAKWIGPDLIDEEGTIVDFFGIKRDGEGYGYALNHPLSHAKTKKDVDAYLWPKPEYWDYDVFVRECEEFEEYAIYGGAWSTFFSRACDLVGMDRFFIMMLENPELAFYIMEKLTNLFYDISRIMYEKAKPDIFFTGDDFGSQEGLLISLPLWRKLIKPHLKKLYSLAKRYGLCITHHSCGSIVGVLPDLIELGLNAIEPIQVRAKNMNFDNLVKEFAGKLVLQGSIDTQQTLPFGNSEDVASEVKSRIALFKKNGGFVLGSSQQLLADIPLENIFTMYETAWEFGWLNSKNQYK